MTKKILVLNKFWIATGVCSVRKAVSLLLTDDKKGQPRAWSLDEDYNIHDWESWSKLEPGSFPIITPSRSFRRPSIILSKSTIGPRQHPGFSRLAVFRRDHHKCCYCGKSSELSIDHVLPKSRGGLNNWTNCVSCCVSCNSKKGDKTPEEANMKLLREPIKPPVILTDYPIPEEWKKFLPNC